MARFYKCKSVAQAFERVNKAIIEEGYTYTSEMGQKCKALNNVMIEITNPQDLTIHPDYFMKEQGVKEYIKQLLEGTDNEFAYTYHDLLFNYEGINQIDYIVDKLKEEKTSRRAIGITWQMKFQKQTHTPCLQLIQFQFVNDELEMTAIFRSNDAKQAFHANAIALIELGNVIAKSLNTKLCRYIHVSNNMHIYL